MPIDSSTLLSLIDIYQTEMDWMIDNLGKNVTLYFTPTITNIIQSVDDHIREEDTRKPSFKLPSAQKPIVSENTLTIKASIRYNPMDFQKYGLNIKDPQGIVRLKTYLTDISNILKCEYIKIPDSEGIIESKYKLLREPIPVGIKVDRYAISFWERI